MGVYKRVAFVGRGRLTLAGFHRNGIGLFEVTKVRPSYALTFPCLAVSSKEGCEINFVQLPGAGQNLPRIFSFYDANRQQEVDIVDLNNGNIFVL